ncbi:MAG: TIM barrel protein, partial [Clostridia bacterium]|nr:TIM barrel protein [Clostridia bacterium]
MIKFGPSGNSEAFYAAGNNKTEESAVWVKDMGLDVFEYSFGRGVNLSDAKTASINAAFKSAGVEITVHAPYYVNLANPEDENAEKSYGYILSSARAVKKMGGNRVVFHPASQGNADRKTAEELTKKRFAVLTEKIYENGLSDVIFCPETMGKLGQIGTIEEITEFCLTDKVFVPCVDFGHVNARERGSLRSPKDYIERLSFMIDGLGIEKMRNFHVHFSKIEYGEKGEI